MELRPEIYEQISNLSESGNKFFNEDRYEIAIANWKAALNLIPDPKSDWDAATWLFASIGDAYYQQGSFGESRETLFNALNCPDGQANPFIHYRLGQCELELGLQESAVNQLLQAYMLDGVDIFQSEADGSKLLGLLKSQNLI